MKPQFDNKVMSSFFLWFDHKLLDKGEAFENVTGQFYNVSEEYYGYKSYSSPYSQLVADASITGATIPTGLYVGENNLVNVGQGGSTGLYNINYLDGKVYFSGEQTADITGSFAIKDFNVYLTNQPEEKILFETKYTERNEKMYTKIGQYLSNIIEMIPNNKIVFFPSYNMIDKIKPSLSLVDNVLIEESGMTKTKKEEILEKMRKSTNNTLLAVSAGSFGESINLEGDALTGVIIVGIPFAKFDLMSKELVNYYDNKFGRGQEYGYTIPAFIKVLQNAGRCIRSETDRGSIIYLDERYGWSIYSKYFPKSTMPRSGGSSNDLEEFFNSDSK